MSDKYTLLFDLVIQPIGIYTDASVKRVKGRDTPKSYFVLINGEEEKYVKLAAKGEDGQVSEVKKDSARFSTHKSTLYEVDAPCTVEIREKRKLNRLAQATLKALDRLVEDNPVDPRIAEIAKILNVDS